MGTRAMKKEIFMLKALKTKGYDVATLIELTEEQINELPLPAVMIDSVLAMKKRGGKTPEEIAEEIAAIMMQTDDSDVTLAPEYFQQTPEQEIAIQEMHEESKTELAEDEVQIVHEIASPEDIEVIRTALQQKEFRSVASYGKHLRSAVPASIFDSVPSLTITELIEARIKEVKAKAE